MAGKILLVEDESITRASTADLLRTEGYEVAEAGDGAQGVELFETRHFDLVITDLVMPRLDGLKLIGRVHSVSPSTPVILITAYLSKDFGKTILQETAEFIRKPIEPAVLVAKVKDLLVGPLV
jgi:DNA-binding response OmpR family regulator